MRRDLKSKWGTGDWSPLSLFKAILVCMSISGPASYPQFYVFIYLCRTSCFHTKLKAKKSNTFVGDTKQSNHTSLEVITIHETDAHQPTVAVI